MVTTMGFLSVKITKKTQIQGYGIFIYMNAGKQIMDIPLVGKYSIPTEPVGYSLGLHPCLKINMEHNHGGLEDYFPF